MAHFRSAFGGLWPDRDDAIDRLAEKLSKGLVTQAEAAQLRHWIDEGWVAIPSAIDAREVEAYTHEVAGVLAAKNDQLKIQVGARNEIVPLDPKWVTPENSVRLLDHFVHSERARSLLLSHPIQHFLSLVFADSPLLFQSLGFEYGSQQGIHQDTAYVVVDSPMTIIGVWIALEDVREGAGELIYYSGSHRLPEYRFSGRYKHWKRWRDGQRAQDEWCQLIHENAKRMSLPLVTFRPAKGTVLFWHADLAHGGAPISRAGETRRSLVGHYCPASVAPQFFSRLRANRTKLPHGNGFYASSHYEISTTGARRNRFLEPGVLNLAVRATHRALRALREYRRRPRDQAGA